MKRLPKEKTQMLSDTQKGLTETRDYSSRRGRRGSSQVYAFGVPSATKARSQGQGGSLSPCPQFFSETRQRQCAKERLRKLSQKFLLNFLSQKHVVLSHRQSKAVRSTGYRSPGDNHTCPKTRQLSRHPQWTRLASNS